MKKGKVIFQSGCKGRRVEKFEGICEHKFLSERHEDHGSEKKEKRKKRIPVILQFTAKVGEGANAKKGRLRGQFKMQMVEVLRE